MAEKVTKKWGKPDQKKLKIEEKSRTARCYIFLFERIFFEGVPFNRKLFFFRYDVDKLMQQAKSREQYEVLH